MRRATRWQRRDKEQRRRGAGSHYAQDPPVRRPYPSVNDGTPRRHPPGRGPAPFRHCVAAPVPARAGAGIRRRASGRAVQGRPVQPDVPADRGRSALCVAQEARRPAAAFGACNRARVPGDPGVAAHRGACRAQRLLVRGRDRDRHAVLRDGVRRGPDLLGPDLAGPAARGTRRAVRRHQSCHRRAASCRPVCRGPVGLRASR